MTITLRFINRTICNLLWLSLLLVACEPVNSVDQREEDTVILPSVQSDDEAADTVFTNGFIYTVDENRTWADSVAIKDGILIAVGTQDDIAEYIGEATKQIDLDGAMMLPGFHDVHLHAIRGWNQQKPMFL